MSYLTSAVQFGFVLGTLVFAVLTLADRFSPSKVFFCCALLGAGATLGLLWNGHTLTSLVALRAAVGFFLAGIYPVGMKIAADYYKEGLGLSLGYLVGALVLGTAFPHLLRDLIPGDAWPTVLWTIAALAVAGGVMMWLLVPDGPHRRPASSVDASAFFSVFRKPDFRAAALGYFGHMWELYAFWTFVPVLLAFLTEKNGFFLSVPLASFTVIAVGGVGCVVGGYASRRVGPRKVASVALAVSGVCCLASYFLLDWLPAEAAFFFLLIWGIAVVTDSPQLSTMVAGSAPAEQKGTALTIVNCLGFAITIVSIELLSWLLGWVSPVHIFLVLGVGPALGLLGLATGRRTAQQQLLP